METLEQSGSICSEIKENTGDFNPASRQQGDSEEHGIGWELIFIIFYIDTRCLTNKKNRFKDLLV